MSVLHDLHCQQKACVHAMRHTRPSSISLYHSSRVPIGLRIVPTLTGSVSRRLGFRACSFWRRAFRMISSNFANSSAENCGMDFSMSASVLTGNKYHRAPLGDKAPLFLFMPSPCSTFPLQSLSEPWADTTFTRVR